MGTPRYREYARDINASGSHLLSHHQRHSGYRQDRIRQDGSGARNCSIRAVIADAVAAPGRAARGQTSDSDVQFRRRRCRRFSPTSARSSRSSSIWVSNAIKFTQEGGQIDSLAASSDRWRSSNLRWPTMGRAFPPPARPHLHAFQPDRQSLQPPGRRHGPGLSLVRACRLHGGKAWIESEIGAGHASLCLLSGSQHAPSTRGICRPKRALF